MVSGLKRPLIASAAAANESGKKVRGSIAKLLHAEEDEAEEETADLMHEESGEIMEPLVHYGGRSFSGTKDDFDDLNDLADVTISSNLSVAFTACWDKLQTWSRIIDFGNGPGRDNIFICNRAKTGAIALHVWDGKKEHSMSVPNAIRAGETHRYLCTVDESGLMLIYKDGHVIGEKYGSPPCPGKRNFLFVGKSNWQWDDPFCGTISDLMLWDAVVDWQGAFGETPEMIPPLVSAPVQEKLVLPKAAIPAAIATNGHQQAYLAAERQRHAAGLRLENAVRTGSSRFYAETLAECVAFGVHFDVRFFTKLLVMQTLGWDFGSSESVRMTLNMAIPADGQIVPLVPVVGVERNGAPMDKPDQEEGSAKDIFADSCKRVIRPNQCKRVIRPNLAQQGASGSPETMIPVGSLRGSIQFAEEAVAEYFSHFTTLLHLETLYELKDLSRQLQQPNGVLVSRGLMMDGFKIKKIWQSKVNRKQGSGLPGRDVSSKRSELILKTQNKAKLAKLRMQSGDSVLISRTDPSVDLLCDGLVWSMPKPGDKFEDEIIINTEQNVDAALAQEGTWRIDKGFNKIVYERQFTALLRLATAGKRHKIWDLLIMTGVGGHNVDEWAREMLKKVQTTHGKDADADEEMEDPAEDEDEANNLETDADVEKILPPTLSCEGRTFDGTPYDYEDLSDEFADVIFGPNFSVMFTACWESFEWWSRVIDFGNGPEDANIFIGNAQDTSTLAFHIWTGTHEQVLHVPDAIQLGETNRYLCTVSDRGCMQVYKDGVLIGEKFGVAPPDACNRTCLFVGKSNFDHDATFKGTITDLKAWDVIVDCKGIPVVVAPLPDPMFEFAGRKYTGDVEDFDDLKDMFPDAKLTANLSIAFNATWYNLNSWSRIIDFGDGEDGSNIFIGNRGRSGTLVFHILSGKAEHSLDVKDVIKVGESHHYLLTVTAEGCMRAYQDGQLVGENEKGGAPKAGSRKHLYLGKSNWDRDEPFQGWITDLKVWDQVIDSEKHAENLDLQIEDPNERLKILSAQEPAKDKLRLKKMRADLANDSTHEGLNPSQKQAISAALGRRLSLVQGPPGTGKTHVSVRLLQSWTRKLGIWPVLATSDSNIAVDNLAEGAHALGLNVVRVGRPEKVTPQTEEILLEAILRKRRAAAQSEVKAIKTGEARPRGSIAKMLGSTGLSDDEVDEKPTGNRDGDWDDYNEKMKLLREADVICCTTNAAGSNFFKNLHFGAILVDEAAQATELSTIVPIVLQGAEQLVLVGDHCQLPPSIACFEAEVRGLSLSLFGRLAAQGINPFFLDTQFRMHPMIAAFSAREFYLGKLNTGVLESDRPPPSGFPWPLDDKGIAFLHVDGPESSDGQSKANDHEATQVAELLKDVLAAGELTYADIGVITPYSSQVRKLREKIRGGLKWQTGAAKTDVQALEIASVDAFQGREKELIIFSAVRSNKGGKVGFLADWRRLNVMITRARRGLIIVGDTGTLRADKTWQRWLSWADEQCLFVHKVESELDLTEYDEENDPLILAVLEQARVLCD